MATNLETLRFSIPNRGLQPHAKFTNIGSVGKTVWRVGFSYDDFDKLWLDIFRNRTVDQVQVDVEVNQGRYNLVRAQGLLLLDGQYGTRLDCGYPVEGGSFKGYVTVHYNLPLMRRESTFVMKYRGGDFTVKKEAVTQTENGIIPSLAERNIPSPQLVSDLLHLLDLDNPDSFSDATLVCGTAKIPVHRGILSARSPVFATMFKTQIQEGRQGVVDIVDMEPDVLQAMLRYVYSGKTDHLTHSLAGDLLFAADKYQLEELKMMCVEQLKMGMAVNNVFRSLVLGDLHDKSLKEYAVEFICQCENFSDLEKSEEWQSLLKNHSHLTVEILTTVVKFLQKK